MPQPRREEIRIATALRATHAWFESTSGWAPPDGATLADWSADGVCRCPDDCLVAVEGVCAHGLASWRLVLDALTLEDALHRRPDADGGRAPG